MLEWKKAMSRCPIVSFLKRVGSGPFFKIRNRPKSSGTVRIRICNTDKNKIPLPLRNSPLWNRERWKWKLTKLFITLGKISFFCRMFPPYDGLTSNKVGAPTWRPFASVRGGVKGGKPVFFIAWSKNMIPPHHHHHHLVSLYYVDEKGKIK